MFGPSGTAPIRATALTYTTESGSPVRLLVIWGRSPAEYAQQGGPPLCATDACSCVFYGHNFELPEGLQEQYGQYAYQKCVQTQQDLADADDEYYWCLARNGGIGVICTIFGCVTGGPVGGTGGALMLGGLVYDCYNNWSNRRASIYRNL
jgi:hypothetical protein